MLAAIAVVVLLVLVGGLYFMFSGGAGTAPTNKPVQGQQRTFTIDAVEGRADVYRNGERVGTTPYGFQAKSGEDLDLVLKREGYLDKTVHLTTSENKKTYMFTLEKKR